MLLGCDTLVKAIVRNKIADVHFHFDSFTKAKFRQALDTEELLHLAVSAGHLQIVEFLLKQEADIESTNSKGRKPLHLAAEKGQLKMVGFLLKKRANIESEDLRGCRPLHLAVREGQLEIFKLLVLKGANVNSKNWRGQTPLQLASKKGCLDMVKILLSRGAIVNSQTVNHHHYSALHFACREGHFQVVQELCHRGAPIEATTKKGLTALHIASFKGHLDIVKALFERSADVNVKNCYGASPIQLAAENGSLEVIKFLISKGVKIISRTQKRMTLLHIASQNGHSGVIQFLLSHHQEQQNLGGQISPQRQISAERDTIRVWALIESRNEDCFTPLHLAASSGHRDVVELLVKNKANIYARNKMNKTARDLALQNHHYEVAKYLKRQTEAGTSSLNDPASGPSARYWRQS